MDTITITNREYAALKEASDILDCLYAGGVDNWEFYAESLRDYYGDEDEDDFEEDEDA